MSKNLTVVTIFLFASAAFGQVLSGFADPEPGRFYSHDAEGPAPEVCFAPISTSLGDSITQTQLDTSLSVDDLINQFSVSLDASGGFGAIKAGTKNSFLNSVQNNDY